MSIPIWEKVLCDCGSEQFLEIKRIKAHPSQGVSTEPAGLQCAACHLIADFDYFKRRIDILRKKQELEEAQQSLDSLQQEKAPPKQAEKEKRTAV